MDWTTASHPVRSFVDAVVETLREQLSERLMSVILHGSLAMGCFYEPKSDIDILALMDGSLDKPSRKKLQKALVELHERRPMIGGLEFSLLNSASIRPFRYPLPFELHFGEEHVVKVQEGEDLLHAGVDGDLAAHIMVARKRGLSLFGRQPEDCLPEVPWPDYVAAVREDFDWIVEGENILISPFYCVLNLCRTLQLASGGEGTIASKEEGALWGLDNLPTKYQTVVRQALDCYRSNSNLSERTAEARRLGGLTWDRQALLEFRDFAVTSLAHS